MKRLLIVILVFAPLLVPSSSFAQDVYNFYFQKADHPGEMVQVKNGESVSPLRVDPTSAAAASGAPTAAASGPMTQTPALAPATIATTLPTAAASREEKKTYWRAQIAQAQFADHDKTMRSGFGVSAEYGLNKYFAFEGQLIGGKSYRYESTGDDSDVSNKFVGALGIKITPMHVELFGWDFLDGSITAGALTSTGRDASSARDFRIAPYVGGAVTINVTDHLAVALDAKFEDVDYNYGQMMTGIAYKF